MTARAFLNQRYRPIRIASYVGLAMLVAVGVPIVVMGTPAAYLATTRHPYVSAFLGVVGLGGAALFMVMLGRASRVLRCPACAARLDWIFQRNWRLHIQPWFRWCPYCGQDFDAELAAGPFERALEATAPARET